RRDGARAPDGRVLPGRAAGAVGRDLRRVDPPLVPTVGQGSKTDYDLGGKRRMATRASRGVVRAAVLAATVLAGIASSADPARANELLDEIVGFNGQVFVLDTKVPAVVIGAIHDGDTSVKGFGERAGDGSPPPDGDTILRIGSITKAFT